MKSAGLMNCFNCHPTHSFLTNNLFPDQVQRSSGSKLLKAVNSLRSSFNGEHRIGHLRNSIQYSTDMLDILQNYTDSINVFLSYDVASGSEIKPCIKICKPLVVYRFSGNVMTSITTLRT